MTEATLHPNALIDAEFARRVYRVIVPGGTRIEDMSKPTYWAHVAMKLRPGDTIEVLCEDNSFYAEFIVRSARRLDATVSLLRKVDLEASDISGIAAEYTVVFRGQKSRWAILRGKDVLKDGYDTENQARAYLTDHLKAMSA